MDLTELLLRQNGLIGRAQALACGLSSRTVQRRVAAGAWREVAPGVYLVAGYRFGVESRVRAAWLWGGPRTLVTGPAAAFWHDLLDRPGPQVDLAVPPGSRRRAPPWIRTCRREVAAEDRTTAGGIALTAPALTVVETVAVLPDGATFLDRALQRRRVRFADLYAAYCRVLGRRGTACAGRCLVAAADRADSDVERTLVRLLRRAGLTGFVVGLPFGETRIDVAFPAARLAVEIDGWAWHTDPARFRADRRKGNDLVACGWTVLRFTWHDVVENPMVTLLRIQEALAAAA